MLSGALNGFTRWFQAAFSGPRADGDKDAASEESTKNVTEVDAEKRHDVAPKGMFWPKVLVCVGCGALLSLALPTPNLWPLFTALTPLFVLVAHSRRVKDAFGYGFFFGVACFALHIIWLPQSFADLYGPFFWLLYPFLLTVLGCFWGVVTSLSRFIGRRGLGTLLMLPALWVLMEWARSQGLFAFPWGTLGYIWTDTPLAQLADLAGVYGLSLLTSCAAALLAVPFVVPARSARWLAPVGTGLLLILGLAYGLYRINPLPSTDQTALLVQGNTDPLGRVTAPGGEVALYEGLTQQAVRDTANVPDLVVWPEGAALEVDLSQDPAAAAQIQRSALQANVIAGGGAQDPRPQFSSYNSAFSISDGEVIDRYDKVYLVPFGEVFPFIGPLEPLYTFIFAQLGLPLLSSRPPGDEIAPLTLPSADAAVYICYESVFPHVTRQMVAQGAEVLVNISNDAWFGRGQGARQHFEMGNMRTIETRRYLLRAGNDGITALVNPLGQVEARLPRGVQGTLLVDYRLREGETLYVRYGDLLILVLAAFTLSFGGFQALRERG